MVLNFEEGAVDKSVLSPMTVMSFTNYIDIHFRFQTINQLIVSRHINKHILNMY